MCLNTGVGAGRCSGCSAAYVSIMAKIWLILVKNNGIYGSLVPIPMQNLGGCQCRYPSQIEHGVPRGHQNDILLLEIAYAGR